MSNSKRYQKFKDLSTHGWYKKLVIKLADDDVAAISSFCEANRFASPMVFEERANRYFLSAPKTKNWKIVLEVLSVISTEKGDLNS